MSDIMKSAFEKAGYKSKEPERQQTSGNTGNSSGFVLKRDYAEQAESIIKDLRNDREMDYRNFTTSKIRNILAMVSEIYNDVVADYGDSLSLELQSRIEYLKIRLVYESGRETRTIKPFVKKAGLLDLLNDIGSSKKKFIDFARYMEALVAYHRFLGGRD